jgi:hypothetical protein
MMLTQPWEVIMIFQLRSVFAASVSALTLTWTAVAAADPPGLKGSYGFTGTAACLVAPGHVGDPNGPPLPNPTPGVALVNSGFQPNLRPNDATPGSSTQAFSCRMLSKGYGSSTEMVRAPLKARP